MTAPRARNAPVPARPRTRVAHPEPAKRPVEVADLAALDTTAVPPDATTAGAVPDADAPTLPSASDDIPSEATPEAPASVQADDEADDDEEDAPDAHPPGPTQDEGAPLGAKPRPRLVDWFRPGSAVVLRHILGATAGAVASIVVADILATYANGVGLQVLATLPCLVVSFLVARRGGALTRTYTERLIDGQPGGTVQGAWLGVVCLGFVAVGVTRAPWAGTDLLGTALVVGPWAVLALDAVTRFSVARQAEVAWYLAELEAGQHARQITEKWVAKIGRPVARGERASALTGTKLFAVEVLPRGGWQARVSFPERGKATWQSLADEAVHIAKVYRVNSDLVFAAPYRAGGARIGRVIVHKTNPLAEATPWRGPTLDSGGRYAAGLYVDGSRCVVRLWLPDKAGTPHWFVAGTTRSGKSGPVQVALSEALLSRRFVTVLMDPAGGYSVPQFTLSERHRVHHFAAGIDETLATLRALRAVADARLAAGLVGRNPGRAVPGVLAFLDEAPIMLIEAKGRQMKAKTVEARQLVSHITRVGAKVSMSLGLLAQQPTLDQLGGEGAIRAQLTAGHRFVFRILDKGGVSVFPGLPMDRLAAISPDMPGAGLLLHNPLDGRSGYVDAAGGRILDALDAAAGERVQLEAVGAAAWEGVLPPQREDVVTAEEVGA